MKVNDNASRRSTGLMIAKNSIVALVLVAVCGFSVWSWFTASREAEANGISVVAKGDGVQVSWDGNNFYNDLTALSNEEVVENDVGPAKNLSGENGVPASLNLVTGNGLSFFEPTLNRRTGEILLTDGKWAGTVVAKNDNLDNSAGRFIDFDLYFRGTAERDIYLTGKSSVLPKNENERISDYGAFSKDNIASASRVAFLNSEMNECSFIWAPNADGHLVKFDGFKRVTETYSGQDSGDSGNLGDAIDFTDEKEGKYYLWLPTDYSSDPNTQDSSLTSKEMEFTVYDKANGTGLYTCEYTITEPNSGKNPTIIYYINQSSTTWNSNDISNVDIANSAANNDLGDARPKVALSGNSFNLNSTSSQTDRRAPGFYVEGFISQSITITVGYNPDTKEVIVIEYSSEGTDTKTYDRTQAVVREVTYYELDDDANCALVNSDYGVAMSTGENYFKSISFSDTSKSSVISDSVSLAEQFTVEKTGEGFKATYKFLSKKTGNYLTISDGSVKLDDVGSDFSLLYSEDFAGPILMSGEYILTFGDAKVEVVNKSRLDAVSPFTVYTGSGYSFKKDSEAQIYQYYDYQNGLQELNAGSEPKLFTSKTTTPETEKIGNTKIASLTKANETDEYYTAHIVVRVWVEGTDREAELPLADGIFNLSLSFTSI